MPDTSVSSANGRGLGLPMTLHTLLEETEAAGQMDIVSWVADGTAFRIHKKFEFVESILPKYFDTSSFKSFQRSINLWNFETVRKGPKKGYTRHPLFQRGNRELCKSMKRVRVKGTGKKRLNTSPRSDNEAEGPPKEEQRQASSTSTPSQRTNGERISQIPTPKLWGNISSPTLGVTATTQDTFFGSSQPDQRFSSTSGVDTTVYSLAASHHLQQLHQAQLRQQLLQNLSALPNLTTSSATQAIAAGLQQQQPSQQTQQSQYQSLGTNGTNLLAALMLLAKEKQQGNQRSGNEISAPIAQTIRDGQRRLSDINGARNSQCATLFDALTNGNSRSGAVPPSPFLGVGNAVPPNDSNILLAGMLHLLQQQQQQQMQL